MVLKTVGALARLASGMSSAAIQTLSDLSRSVSDEWIVSLINALADQFEPIPVPVQCVPTGPCLDDYKLEVDLNEFETALQTNRYVRPQIMVYAVSNQINRELLTQRLIDTFSVVLVEHEQRMKHLERQKMQRMEKTERDLSWSLTGATIEFFLNAAMLALLGLGALVGPLFWLLIGFGGIAILIELPSVAWSLLKRAVGIREGEDKEILELQRQLERYRPLLERMVADATIIVDPELSQQRQR